MPKQTPSDPIPLRPGRCRIEQARIEQARIALGKLKERVAKANRSLPHVVAAYDTLLYGARLYGPFKNWKAAEEWAKASECWHCYESLPLLPFNEMIDPHTRCVAYTGGMLEDSSVPRTAKQMKG